MIRYIDDIYVSVLDFGPLERKALEELRGTDILGKIEALKIRLPHGVITTTEGIYILDINGEGCEEPITENKMAEIALYAVYTKGSEQKVTPSPACHVSLTLDMLFAFLPIVDRVKLAAFISEGSDILDMRYTQWRNRVKDIYVDVKQ